MSQKPKLHCDTPGRCENKLLSSYVSPYTGHRHETRECALCGLIFFLTKRLPSDAGDRDQ